MPDSPFSAEAVKAALVQMLDEQQPAQAPPKKSHAGMHASLAVMGGGQLADALSTIAALKREGVQEGNSAVYGKHPSAGKILGIKAATMIPAGFILDKLHDSHPTLAKALALGIGGLGAGVAVRNSQVGK